MSNLKKMKIVCIGILVAILIGGIIVTAQVIISNQSVDGSEDIASEVTANIESRKSNIEKQIEEKGIVDGDLYSKMILATDSTVENSMEYNDVVFNYEYLKEVYGLEEEQLNYIAELIINGYYATDVIDAVYFWLDTPDDISIVEKMCILKDERKGSIWTEDAYNIATDDKCGVLTEDDANKYMGMGLTPNEILIANKLCRKGKMTIYEILDKLSSGESLYNITAEIYDVPGEIASELVSKTEAAEENIKLLQVSNVSIISELDRRKDMTAEDCYKMLLENKDLREFYEQTDEEMSGNITSNLRERGVYKKVSAEDKQAYDEK